jgi:hypothetical protein
LVALQFQHEAYSMQVAVLLHCCLQSSSLLLGPPDQHFTTLWAGALRSGGPCGQPASSHMQRILPYAAYAAPVSQMQPTGSQMHPPRCPISARMPPCGQADSTICCVFCNMLHMQRLCSQMQPTDSQIHPSGVKYQPRGSPVANQPAAICSVYCNTAAYEGPVQPNAAHRRPNAPPRCIISAPMQPKPIPMSPLATKFGTHGKPNYHPRTKNAPD